jgi:gamma-glutamyl hercynylcysteine S-oxide synthase
MRTDRFATYPVLDASPSSLREDIVRRLEDVRARTLALIAPITEEDLRFQHDPLMSPILWDLGHIAHFEELWLVQQLGRPVKFGEMPGLYNPFEHPRRERGELPLPTLHECLREMESIRERTLDGLATADFESDDALLRHGYVYAMVLQHECQHNETILQTLQLKQGSPYRAPRTAATPPGSDVAGMVRFPGGTVRIGTSDRRAAYDNERPRHERQLAPFHIDVAPVTNGDFVEFISAGGYDCREWWSDAGWRWRSESNVEAPKYWRRQGSTWVTRTMDREGEIDARRPVCHVSFHEAEAFARFVGKRLPTEIEWEVAASWSPTDDERV